MYVLQKEGRQLYFKQHNKTQLCLVWFNKALHNLVV